MERFGEKLINSSDIFEEKDGLYIFQDSSTFDILTQEFQFAPSKEIEETVTEISRRELAAIAPIFAIIIALGFAPQVALNVINPAVEQVQTYVGVTDPEVAVVIEGSGS